MSDARTLYLMRHGEPELTGRLLGSTDCAVAPAGVSTCVAQAFDLEFDAIVTSDLRRAVDCARAIAGARPVTIDPRWRELEFGAWDGQSSADIDPAALARFWADPDRNAPPRGERWSSLTARVATAVAAIDAPSTLVVTHGGAIRAALAVLCGFAQPQLWSFDLPYAAVVTLKIWPDTPRKAQIVALRP